VYTPQTGRGVVAITCTDVGMMKRRLTWMGLVAGALVMGGCAALPVVRKEGPFLRPGPLGPKNGGIVRSGVFVPAAQYTAHVPPVMPAGFSAAGGREVLPGGTLPGIGAVRGVVASISLGERVPLLNERALATQYFGTHSHAPATVANAFARESGGTLRLQFDVLPTLVNPAAEYSRRAPTEREVVNLAKRALLAWSEEMDLRAYDNDGPDGIPGSPDDDGVLDLAFVVVESEHGFRPFTIAEGVRFGKRGSGRLESGPIHVISAARGVMPDLRIPVDQILASLGVGPSERFFPAGYPRTISTVARARLGWLDVQPGTIGGSYTLADQRAMLVPLTDLPVSMGFWLVERNGDRVYTSRVAMRPDGRYQVTDSVHWERGSEQPLPLSYHLGARGPTALVRWATTNGAPEVRIGGGVTPAVNSPDLIPSPWGDPAPAGGGSPGSRGGWVRAASSDIGHRWVMLGSDSVSVPIAGAPLALP
jgi:hypothetical protein